MSDFKSYSIEEKELGTVFSEDFEFEGEANFKSPVIIKGKINGQIQSSSVVYLSKTSKLEGRIESDSVNIRGNLHGNVNAKMKIELENGSAVTGSLEAPDISIESGANFNGSCKMPQTKNKLEDL